MVCVLTMMGFYSESIPWKKSEFRMSPFLLSENQLRPSRRSSPASSPRGTSRLALGLLAAQDHPVRVLPVVETIDAPVAEAG